jgi:cobalt-zinc-cadmium efflux system protein
VHAHADHEHAATSSQKLAMAFGVSLTVLVLEVIGGLASNSLALLSDAGHLFTDVFAIALAWFASVQAARPPTLRQTYGFHRAGILAAFVNAATLVLLAVFISVEAYRRLLDPHPVAGETVLVIAVIGLAANLGVAWYLREPGTTNLNLRAALAHVLGDALASAVVIVGAIAIMLGGPVQVDALLSIVIAIIIVFSGATILRDSLNVLMESAPRGLDVGKLIADVEAVPGVVAMHDVHVWSLAAHLPALSAHVRVEDDTHPRCDQILVEIQHLLAERYGIAHNTLQLECAESTIACTSDAGGPGCAPRRH